MSRIIKTTIKQIADYWYNSGLHCETELNFDWSEAETHCWNCGDDKKKTKSKGDARLERAHIKPHTLGGEDTPSNYVLLCKTCHSEAPNSSTTDHMWNWIKSNRTQSGMYGFYRFHKADDLFKLRKGYSFLSDVLPNLKCDIILAVREQLRKTAFHGFNKHNIETIYALYCDMENNYPLND